MVLLNKWGNDLCCFLNEKLLLYNLFWPQVCVWYYCPYKGHCAHVRILTSTPTCIPVSPMKVSLQNTSFPTCQMQMRPLSAGMICSGCNLTHTMKYEIKHIIPQLHNLLFQCDITRSLNRYEARSKLFNDQRRTTLYRLLRYIDQYRCNAVFT